MCGYTLGSQTVPYCFSGHCDLDLCSRKVVSKAYLRFSILLEVDIPNKVCGYTLGVLSVTKSYYFWVTVTFTSDLNSRKIVSGAYLLYYLR